MKTEDKELLLKDLCARLPYKPIVHAKWSYRETDGKLKYKEADRKLEINDIYAIQDIKPYLRPMSSMTEEEWDDFNAYRGVDGEMMPIANELDWLNEHHFDYRGLIPMELAIEAPEGMYK